MADLAGFDSYKTMERAAKVVENGTKALVAAMDSGDVSISMAAKIAKLPKAEQGEAMKNGLPKGEAKELSEDEWVNRLHDAVAKALDGMPITYRTRICDELLKIQAGYM